MPRCLLASLAVLGLGLLLLGPPRALGQREFTQAEVESALLGQLLRFVEWPERVFEEESAPLEISVVGGGPLLAAIRNNYAHSRLAGRDVIFRRPASIEGMAPPHVLVITESANDQVEAAVARFANSPVLIVAESRCATTLGASVHFFVDGGRVRFEVNRTALRRAGLSVSYHLMRYAATEGGCE